MKNECDIIKDLLPNYIENLLSEKTKKYVEGHINDCSQCEQVLEMMQDDKIKIGNDDKREQEVELDHLKKYRRKLLVFKASALCLLLVILITSILFIMKFCKVNSIINNANNKKQELAQIENYSICTSLYHIDYNTEKQYITYDEYYYKDGKYKETSNIYGINFSLQGETSYLNYGDDYDNRQKEEYINNLFNSFSLYYADLGFANNIKVRIGLTLKETIRKDKFNGSECYIFRAETEEYYREIWIDKDRLIPIKEIQEVYGQMHDEKIISFCIGNVKDEDVASKQDE